MKHLFSLFLGAIFCLGLLLFLFGAFIDKKVEISGCWYAKQMSVDGKQVSAKCLATDGVEVCVLKEQSTERTDQDLVLN